MEDADFVHRSLSDAAGKKASRAFDARLTQSILLPPTEPPYLDASSVFMLPRLPIETGCSSVPIDFAVERVRRPEFASGWHGRHVC